MIIDAYERAGTVGSEDAIRQFYLVGGDKFKPAVGHIIFDCAATICFIHAQMYDKKLSSIKMIKEDILDLIDLVLIKEFQYPFIASYTPNKRFLDYVVKGTGWEVQVVPQPELPDLTICVVDFSKKEPT